MLRDPSRPCIRTRRHADPDVHVLHPSLVPASAIPSTLRAVGGLTTREIATAFLVSEATMAQRISRAKATVRASADDATNRAACVSVVLALGARGGNDDAADTTTPPSSSVPASTDETSASPRPSPESTEPESTEPESTDIAPTEPAPTDSADDSVATSPPSGSAATSRCAPASHMR